ncbi:MAG: trans-aconitate 2-methyltransferase [Vicinamibacterales bacterium]
MPYPSWTAYWSDRRLDTHHTDLLDQLLAADGYADPGAAIDQDAWRRYVADVAEALEIGPDTSVYEVGCGAGAFLVPLDQIGCRVGGSDPSAALVAAAGAAMPDGRWSQGEGAAVDPAEPWDIVVCNGAFAYLPDHDYARGVLARMAAKATRGFAVLDVPDADDAEAAARALASARHPESPDRSGLHHTRFGRSWFLHQLAEIGVTAVHVAEQRIPDYEAGVFRFNVFARL